MARQCSICAHKKRQSIEAALAAGEALRGIARLFRVSEDALQRHKSHIKEAIHLVQQGQQEQSGINVLSRLLRDAALIDEAFQQVWKEGHKDVELLLRVLSESRQQNKLAAEWQRDTAVDQMQERLKALEQQINDLYRARSA